jgi:hypothetical protein
MPWTSAPDSTGPLLVVVEGVERGVEILSIGEESYDRSQGDTKMIPSHVLG